MFGLKKDKKAAEILPEINYLLIKDDAIGFVKQTLDSPRIKKGVINRFKHSMRVLRYVNIIYEASPYKASVDIDSLSIAAIFHDIGYSVPDDGRGHAVIGAEICRNYLYKVKYPEDKIPFICDLIAKHSNKEELHAGTQISEELLTLMEADMLVETGAHAIVIDVKMELMTNPDASFRDILEHLKNLTGKLMQTNPMVSAKARAIWEEKRQLVDKFIASYEDDLRLF